MNGDQPPERLAPDPDQLEGQEPSVPLAPASPSPHGRRREQAESDFALWHDRGLRCLETFAYLFENGHHRHAAYDLFQAAEAFYGALLLVFIGEKPWVHDLRMFNRTAMQCDPLLAHVFPEVTAEDRRLFRLLNDACMGARYDKEFTAAEADLRILQQRVLLLQALTERLCRARIAGLR